MSTNNRLEGAYSALINYRSKKKFFWNIESYQVIDKFVAMKLNHGMIIIELILSETCFKKNKKA